MGQKPIGRRDFLRLGLAGAATAAVGIGASRRKSIPLGLVDAVAERPAAGGHTSGNSAHRWAMVIDQSKCIGCELCVKACSANNDVDPEHSWTRMEHEPANGSGEEVYRPVPCMHCQDAPCVEICPVGASYRRDDGIVMMDYERCIGCRYCQLACPYGARHFNWETYTADNPNVPAYGLPEMPRRPRGVAEKCSFCYQRIDRGLAFGLTPGVDAAATPACVVACPEKARLFGDLNDPNSPVSVALRNAPDAYRLREELGTEPRVYYIPAAGPEESAS